MEVRIGAQTGERGMLKLEFLDVVLTELPHSHRVGIAYDVRREFLGHSE